MILVALVMNMQGKPQIKSFYKDMVGFSPCLIFSLTYVW